MRQDEQNKRYITNLNQDAIDFLLYSYFGIDNRNIKNIAEEEFKKTVAKKCAQRAYLDLARTLTFNEKLKKKGEEKERQGIICRKEFSAILCEFIVESIEKKMLKNPENFGDMHNKICTVIEESARCLKFETGKEQNEIILIPGKQNKSFYYGQAQKWLNMTLKYMWLIGLWKEKFEEIKDDNGNLDLDVPVDRYIIQAAKKEGLESSNEPWSQWDESDYSSFQKKLKEKTFKKGGRMHWETDVWITFAEKNKEDEMDNLKKYKGDPIRELQIYQEDLDEEKQECADVKELKSMIREIIERLNEEHK